MITTPSTIEASRPELHRRPRFTPPCLGPAVPLPMRNSLIALAPCPSEKKDRGKKISGKIANKSDSDTKLILSENHFKSVLKNSESIYFILVAVFYHVFCFKF